MLTLILIWVFGLLVGLGCLPDDDKAIENATLKLLLIVAWPVCVLFLLGYFLLGANGDIRVSRSKVLRVVDLTKDDQEGSITP